MKMDTLASMQVKKADARAASASHSGVLQRKCACGTHLPGGGECAKCAKTRRTESSQQSRHLAIGQPGDRFEQGAERMADHVLAATTHPGKGHFVPRIQRLSAQPNAQAGATPPSVDRALASPGTPLASALRIDMERRFDHDFSGVRIHAGTAAEQSARDVDAYAYTVGSSIVFGAGQFAPRTHAGRHLLAHELAHVVQQGAGVRLIQRASCPTANSGAGNTVPLPDCGQRGDRVDGARFLFCRDSDVMRDVITPYLPMSTFIPALNQLDTIDVHGYASVEGPRGRAVEYNLNLSCKRANRIADLLASYGIQRSRIRTFKHGGTSAFGSSEVNRVVTIPLPRSHSVRVAAVSMLACVPCNPFTDDGRDAVAPPTSETSIGTFRQKHSIQATVRSTDGRTLVGSSAQPTAILGKTGYCGREYPPHQVARSGGGRRISSPLHGEGIEENSYLSARVGAEVPCTLLDPLGRKPGAPCGYMGTNPHVPAIGNRFYLRLYADGTSESGFLSATTFPFHYLYENGNLKTSDGAPVHPRLNYSAWATSTGVSERDALVGFKALRSACCSLQRGDRGFIGCPCECSGGETVLRTPTMAERMGASMGGGSVDEAYLAACAGAALGALTGNCPTPCATVGTDCNVLERPANP